MQKRYVTCLGNMYEVSNEDWNRFLTEIATSTASGNTVNADRVTRNEMFVKVGERPFDLPELTPETCKAILDGRSYEEVRSTRQQHAGAGQPQQQQTKTTI